MSWELNWELNVYLAGMLVAYLSMVYPLWITFKSLKAYDDANAELVAENEELKVKEFRTNLSHGNNLRWRQVAEKERDELVEAFEELYLCFKTCNDESEVAQRIIKKFAKHGGGK